MAVGAKQCHPHVKRYHGTASGTASPLPPEAGGCLRQAQAACTLAALAEAGGCLRQAQAAVALAALAEAGGCLRQAQAAVALAALAEAGGCLRQAQAACAPATFSLAELVEADEDTAPPIVLTLAARGPNCKRNAVRRLVMLSAAKNPDRDGVPFAVVRNLQSKI